MRNRKGLNQRQAKFVRMILEMEKTTDEIMRGLKMTMGTLTKWMKEEAFKLEWEEANLVLLRLCESEEASCRINAARYRRKRMRKRARMEPGLGDVGSDAGAGKAGECDDGKAVCAPGLVDSISGDGEGEAKGETVADSGGGAGRKGEGMTERERIRSLHGEEAAGAFDRLVRLREMKRAERMAAAVGKVAGEMVAGAVEEAGVGGEGEGRAKGLRCEGGTDATGCDGLLAR